MQKNIFKVIPIFIIGICLGVILNYSINYLRYSSNSKQDIDYTYSSSDNSNILKESVELTKNQIKDQKIDETYINNKQQQFNNSSKIKIIVSDKKLKDINTYDKEKENISYNQINISKINIEKRNGIQNEIDKEQNYNSNENEVQTQIIEQENLKNNDPKQELNEKSNTLPVFKVKSSQIITSLTFGEKLKLLQIAKKLNPKDYVKVEEYLKSKDAEQGVINTIHLLKERLCEEDYEEIKDIADRFINMEVIEKETSIP